MACGSNDNKKYPGFKTNKMLIRRTLQLHEMSVYTHGVNNMAEGSTGVT